MALTKVYNRMIEGSSVNVRDFGAVGDGVTDDTAAIQAALTAAGSTAFLIFENKTYIFDGILSLNLIKSEDATLKLKDSATVTGGANDYLVDVVGGAIIQGKITIDANRDNNTVAPAAGTIPGVAVRLNGSNHSIDHIKAINSWNNGFNSPIGNTGNVNNSTIGTIEAHNCSGGIYLNFQNNTGRVGNIIAISMDAKYTNSNPHAVDIFNGDGIVVESIYIDGVTGTSDASSVWYTGLTILNVINSTIGSKGVTIKNYTGSQLIPLASSILSAKNTTFLNWHCEKYSQNNLMEISGCGTCVFDNVSLIADYGETYTGASAALTVGIRIADDAVINFSQGRQHFASSNNVFKNIFMENMGTAIEDGGIDNRFENVRVYGSLFAGYVARYVNIGSGYPSVASPIFGGATLIDCEFSYCDGPGIEIRNGARPVNIINCKTIGNGKDSSLATLHLSGIKMLNAATDYNHKIINHNGNDDYATLIKTGLFSAEEGNVFSDTRTFPCTALDGAHFLRAGMRFTLVNAAGGVTSVPVRVEHMPYASDLFDVRPITPAASGVISNGASVALTGTFSGVAGSRIITGVGSSLTTEIAGRAYITLGGVVHQVGSITSNTQMTLVQPLAASISSVSGTLHVSDSTASASQQVAYYGSQVDVKGMTFDGNISASPTSGNRIGQKEVRLINVPAAGSAVLTLDNTYPEIPYATATVVSSIVNSCSVSRTSKTALTIHNGAAGARDIMVFVEF